MKNIQKPTKSIRRGDRVVAIAGNDKGMSGIVQSIQGSKAIVQGLNMRKKNFKKTQEVPTGRVVQMEESIHISNLKVCVEGDIPVKLKIDQNEKGERRLVYKKDNQVVVYRSVKKPK